MTPDECRDYIRALVDAAPPLSAEQRARLGVLLQPAPNENGPRMPVRGAATSSPSSPTTDRQDITCANASTAHRQKAAA